ncbi:MAG: tyrosine-type recombinase/integrase, partial [Acidobacteria bacterium]|nr:tyrosine-type recombinase/integrase [Acidobacteriota bacterium]
MGRLTAALVRALSKPGRYGDGGTLFLRVAPGGSKGWVQRLTISGKRRDLGLGGWPLVTLSEAREQAMENRRHVRRGGDPLADKRRAKEPTFMEASDSALEANRRRWRNAKTVDNWRATMEKYARPVFGDRRVDQIGREDVLQVLLPVWTAKPEIGRKVRQRIRATLAWAQAHGHVAHNVAGEAINAALPSMMSLKTHFRALPYQDVAAALDTIEVSRASISARACLRFLVLTACRSGEARGATWAELDLEAAEWRIPASRMKGGAEHRVPLSEAAAAALEAVRPLRGPSDLVFPSPSRPGRPLSDMTLTKVLRDTGLADRATVHGFRTAFRTWASERTNAAHAVMGLCLAHHVGTAVERAYARSDLLAKRRRLMDQWAAF